MVIIINSKTRIGLNDTVYQNVTIGSKQFGSRKGCPILGDNVIIYPNSVVIGQVKIGNNSIIGAGSVIISDVPNNVIVAGNPATIVGNIKQC